MNSDWIEIDPDVCNGRPVLRGTRIAVQSVLGNVYRDPTASKP